ncbi:hypothetical protein MHPYR_260026 [uncultured Mycobacterium sp.]|uniref:Methyltransferase n=1 Tax=uncultured Mycobacterium sp. TaxID=171292 RepID=A0A1Y5PEE8_9MYCO|nr:hypothetical protein MHPYR_240031 [uncultured Mycobacterium sp.]SBS75699.1 hypothetical protein MHPYR_260026 [uncultured Mycobacterium sp.]
MGRLFSQGGLPGAFPDAAEYNFWNSSIEPTAARLLGVSSALRTKTIDAGRDHPLWEIADFVDWQRRTFGYRPEVYGRREKLWEQVAQRLDPNRSLFVLEFGVAWGYATHWWLRRLRGRDVTWHGFDRFTGLPRAWRGLDEGAFDAGGQPPAIEDERVCWHVGDVEDTLGAVDLVRARGAQWLVLFDMDIYEPTAYAWETISPHLLPGDAIYFDEAMDQDERRLLDEAVLPSIGCELVGTTPMALAFSVTQPVDRG